MLLLRLSSAAQSWTVLLTSVSVDTCASTKAVLVSAFALEFEESSKEFSMFGTLARREAVKSQLHSEPLPFGETVTSTGYVGTATQQQNRRAFQERR